MTTLLDDFDSSHTTTTDTMDQREKVFQGFPSFFFYCKYKFTDLMINLQKVNK
jgi:hypothetical protein